MQNAAYPVSQWVLIIYHHKWFRFFPIRAKAFLNNYDLNFSIRNVFDQEYEQAHEYSSMARTLNFSLKRKY